MTINYYTILGINEGASLEEIKKAYKGLALKWHPDKNKNSEESKKKMQEIGEAYEKLNDEGIRKVKYNPNYYDYEVPTDGALIRETLKDLDDSYNVLRTFYVGEYDTATGKHKRSGETVINDYDIVRVKRLLRLLNAVSEMNKEGREFESVYGNRWKSARVKYIKELKEAARNSGQGYLFWWFDENTEWENNINRIKLMLNTCLEKMKLDKLTDQDFRAIETGNQNESPKIPGNKGPDKVNGNQEPPKIKDGVTDVEDYNKLYYRGKHEIIDKYWKLRGAIYNTLESWEKYRAVNSDLLNQIEGKSVEAEQGNFQEIWAKDDEGKINKIKKFNAEKLEIMKEAIKLMEKIIEEGKNYTPAVANTQPGSKKHEAEFEARQEVSEKNKTIGDELARLIKEAQEVSNYESLETKIKEIDKYRGEASYDERYKEEISQLKSKLGDLDKDKYRENIIEKIKNELTESGIKEDDLDKETKESLSKVRSGEIRDIAKINEIENKVAVKTNEQKAKNTLSDLLEEAKKLIKGITKETPNYLQKQLHKIKKDLYSFSLSTNTYWKLAYQDKEKDVKQMLDKLENYSVQNNQQPKSNFFRKEVVIPLALLAIILTSVIIVIRKRSRQNKEVE